MDRDAQLAQVLAEVAHTLGNEFSIRSTLDHLVERIVEAHDMAADSATRAIVAAVIDLAHALDLFVVAEGVETEAQLRQVSELGADRAQGHYLCAPLLAEALGSEILGGAGAASVRLPLQPPVRS